MVGVWLLENGDYGVGVMAQVLCLAINSVFGNLVAWGWLREVEDYGLGVMVQGLGFRVHRVGVRVRVWGSGVRGGGEVRRCCEWKRHCLSKEFGATGKGKGIKV